MPRYPVLDAARGVAVGLMVGYHFCYDLVWFRLVYFDFQHHWFWLGARAFIVGAFVLISGISLVFATAQGVRRRAWARRWGILAACAAAVTIGSYFAFPQRFIFFGILHFLLAASLAGLACLRWDKLNALLGALCIGVGIGWQHPWFDHAALQWIGFTTAPPETEDYVPFLPWFGVMLWGLFVGRRAWFREWLASVKNVPGALAWTGRHSLAVYMLHQPVLLGILGLAVSIVR